MKFADLPSIDDMPISPDARPGIGWTAAMIEMAEHIGAYETLLISANIGGQEIYVTMDPDRNALRDVVGPEKAAILSRIYGGERMIIPLARTAIHRARRAPIIAAVRARELTVAEAARIMGTRRDYVSRLVNATDEGRNTPALRLGRRKADPRQIDMFGEGDGAR